jgi:TetR/AcrR family transcriptional repressor of nem operon
MRYSPDYKAKARAKLIATASALSKEKGFGTSGVDALTAAAGMTSGAFYSHFKSKPDLLRAIVDHELQRTLGIFEGASPQALRSALGFYLSETHVAHPERGCMLPSLSAEVARADEETKTVFESHLTHLRDSLQAHASEGEDAWALIAQAVGAVMLARAVEQPETRRALLGASLQSIEGKLKK